MLAPFIVFTRVFLAPEIFPGLFAWAIAAVAINAGLTLAVIRLDSRTYEHSLTVNERLDRRWRREARYQATKPDVRTACVSDSPILPRRQGSAGLAVSHGLPVTNDDDPTGARHAPT